MKKQPVKDDKKNPDRALRGGSWRVIAWFSRVSSRLRLNASSRNNDRGFRIVKNKDTKK